MTSLPHILVADDERSIRLTLDAGLALNGFRVTSVRTGREAVAAAREQQFDAVVCDVFMPDGDGLSVVRELRTLIPAPPIILMTAQGSIDLAVQAVSEGASDFIAKPFEVSDVANLVRRYIATHREADSVDAEESNVSPDAISRTGLIGRSAAMMQVYKLVAHAARSEATVLVIGESGTGKELVARAIHKFSERSANPFIAVNCSGLTDTLLESELFGHIKGAFTGANSDREGLFEAADGGTLFLDELASTSAAFQASLLRVLQSGEIRRVGSTTTQRVNVRVIGASNAPLRQMVAAGTFRADLFYRLSVLTVDLPPLRQRTSDIELLAAHFLRRIGGDEQPPFRMAREIADVLRNYGFPGNVRELENALTRAAALSSNRLITLECLPPHILEPSGTPNSPTIESSSTSTDEALKIIADRPTLDELQRRYLQLMLNELGGNRRLAADRLGINRRTIQRLIARYRLSALADEEGADDLTAPEKTE